MKNPTCGYCTWPLAPNEVHDYCNIQIITDRLAKAFANNEESGWQMINSGISWKDGTQQAVVMDNLNDRDVLFACLSCSARSVNAFVNNECNTCASMPDEPEEDHYDPRDDYDNGRDDQENYALASSRIDRHYGAGTELAREAKSMFPGDFI